MDGEIRNGSAVSKGVSSGFRPRSWLIARAERGAVEMAYDLCELARRDEVSWDAFDAFVTWVNSKRPGCLAMWWFGSPMHTSELTPALRLAWSAFEPAFADALHDLRCR